MFSDQSFYESKIFLKAYKDAINCLRESAETQQRPITYQKQLDAILQAKSEDQITIRNEDVVKNKDFKNAKLVKLNQFSNHIFKTYFDGLDSQDGNFAGLSRFLNNGLEKMKQEVV